MPRVRKGPGGPKKSVAGKKGTNKRTPHKGAGTSNKSHIAQLLPRTKGTYKGGGY
jgi:hypothetical protein